MAVSIAPNGSRLIREVGERLSRVLDRGSRSDLANEDEPSPPDPACDPASEAGVEAASDLYDLIVNPGERPSRLTSFVLRWFELTAQVEGAESLRPGGNKGRSATVRIASEFRSLLDDEDANRRFLAALDETEHSSAPSIATRRAGKPPGGGESPQDSELDATGERRAEVQRAQPSHGHPDALSNAADPPPLSRGGQGNMLQLDTSPLNSRVLDTVLSDQSPEVREAVTRRLLLSYWSQRPIDECPLDLLPDDEFSELPDADVEEVVVSLLSQYYAEVA